MIVLGSLERTDDLTLVIPPFHTGHLGLLPGTEVHVGLMTPFTQGPRHCEVVVTPFHQPTTSMALVRCTLLDRIGVVGKLVKAVSDLNINIVTLDSTVLNHLDHHLVAMLLDFSTSSLKSTPSSDRARHQYAHFESCFPVQDERFVRLFESIALHSADVWTMRQIAGRSIPNVHMEPLSERRVSNKEGAVEVGRHPALHFHVTLTLPRDVGASLRQSLGIASPLHYMLFSDTDERTLRIFFPRPATIPNIYRVAFYHNDNPGALNALLTALANTKFNILASLLRGRSADRSVWEAVLEYQGRETAPGDGSAEARVKWVTRQLTAQAENPHELTAYEIEVGLPLYPKPEWRGTIPLSPLLSTTGAPPVVHNDRMDLLNRTKCAIRDSERPQEERLPLEGLMACLDRRLHRTKPVVFLSYPAAARPHAKLVGGRLRDTCELLDYYRTLGETTLAEVVSRILGSDCFLGIWHHDAQMPMGDGKYNISPWMPFEYGVALAAGKPCLVVHSAHLHELVWKRINPGMGSPEYTDLYFQSSTLETIAKHCVDHWLPTDAAPSPAVAPSSA